jgi:hypothetical protein
LHGVSEPEASSAKAGTGVAIASAKSVRAKSLFIFRLPSLERLGRRLLFTITPL